MLLAQKHFPELFVVVDRVMEEHSFKSVFDGLCWVEDHIGEYDLVVKDQYFTLMENFEEYL